MTGVAPVPEREDSFWQMVGDIVRETSPVIRCCVLIGIGVGVGGAVWIIVKMVSSGAITTVYGGRGRRLDAAFGGLIFFGDVLGGLFAGLVVGVVIELMLEHLFGITFDVPGTRKRKKRRY
jgi:hypothetical protein